MKHPSNPPRTPAPRNRAARRGIFVGPVRSAHRQFCPVAQSAERPALDREAGGSNPPWATFPMVLLAPRGADAPRGVFAFGRVFLGDVPPLRLTVEQQKRRQESWQKQGLRMERPVQNRYHPMTKISFLPQAAHRPEGGHSLLCSLLQRVERDLGGLIDVVQNGFLVVSARSPIRERAAKTSEVLFCRFLHKSDSISLFHRLYPTSGHIWFNVVHACQHAEVPCGVLGPRSAERRSWGSLIKLEA